MELSTAFHDMARRYFFTVLPESYGHVCDIELSNHLANGHKDDLFMDLKKSGFVRSISRLIPVSNTFTSRSLRMAAAESIMAELLLREVFQPLNFLEDSTKTEMNNTLDNLFNRNPQQEALLRSLLFSTYANSDQHYGTRIVEKVGIRANTVLSPLLFSQAIGESFQLELKALLYRAVDLWSQVQRSPERVLASSKQKNEKFSYYEEFDDGEGLTAAEKAVHNPVTVEPVMTLFPSVSVAKDDVFLHHGYFLLSSQNVVVAGDKELHEQVNRVNQRNERTMSLSAHRKSSTTNPTSSGSSHQRGKTLDSATDPVKAGHNAILSKTLPTRIKKDGRESSN